LSKRCLDLGVRRACDDKCHVRPTCGVKTIAIEHSGKLSNEILTPTAKAELLVDDILPIQLSVARKRK
jgi:hypothetical protein